MEISFPIELQRQVEQAIIGGEWATGQQVSVLKLAACFGVTLGEMSLVLLSEQRKGLVAQDSVNTFRVLSLIRPQVESVFQHTSKVGFKPSSKMRNIVIEPASSEIAERLAVPVGAPVYRLDRTRLVNGEVFANQMNVIPFEVCAGLEHDDVSHASFQQLIDGKYHAVTTQVKEEFEILPATNEDLEILCLNPTKSVLAIRRLALSATSTPLIWTDIHVRTDRFEYVAALWPSAKTLIERYQLGGKP